MTSPRRKLSLIVLILLLGYTPVLSFSHVPKMDSLKSVFETSTIDTVKYHAARSLIKIFYNRDAQQGLKYAMLAFDLAKDLDKQENYASHHAVIGTFLIDNGRYSEAIKEFEKGLLAVEYIQEDPARFLTLCGIYTNLGVALGHVGRIEEEQAVYLKGLAIAEEQNFLEQQVSFANNISKLYLDLGNFSQAKVYVDKVFELLSEGDFSKSVYVLPFLNRGALFLGQNQPDSAVKYFEIGLKYSEEAGSLYEKGAALIQLSEYLVENNRYDQASDYINQAVKISQELGNKELAILADLGLARVKRKMGNLDMATKCANRALSMIDESIPVTELKVYEELEKIALARSNYRRAQEIGMKIRTLKDTLLNVNRQNYMANAESRRKLDKLKIESLEKDKQLRQKVLEQRNTILLFSWAALVLAILAAAFLFRIIQQRKNYHRKLEHMVAVRTEKLKELNEDFAQANFELKRFNRVLSHDLKAPVHNIKALLELLEVEIGDVGDSMETMEMIERSADQIIRLIEDVSLLYNFDKKQLKLETFAMKDIVEEISLALKIPMETKKARLIFDELPVIQSYWIPVFLVFKNLIENGLKFNESKIPEITISYNRTASEHLFEVSDNGIGISKDNYDRIFEVFQRVSAKGTYDGSGLGLSISKKMIQNIGGEIRVKESNLDSGSLFEVRLPISSTSITTEGEELSHAQ